MSTCTPDLARHRVPAGAKVVMPTHCDNCARTLFVKNGGKHLCVGCSTSFEIDAQLWCCDECGTARKYGEGRPEETTEKFLKCVRCAEVTPHLFYQVFRSHA